MKPVVELQTRIESVDPGSVVFIDEAFEDVWVSIQTRGGSAHACVSKEEARRMIEALQRVINA
jgi:L-lactate utilization protein LutB